MVVGAHRGGRTRSALGRAAATIGPCGPSGSRSASSSSSCCGRPHVQPPRPPAQPRRQRLVADRRAAPAPLRPDPEPRGDGARATPRTSESSSRRSPRRARAARRPPGSAPQAEAENAITAGLRQLLAVVEAYPDLKANENFLALQEELTGTESKIAYARQFYNDQVMRLNTAIQPFPRALVARLFGFTEREFFDIDDPVRGPVAGRPRGRLGVRADRREQAQDVPPARSWRSSSSVAIGCAIGYFWGAGPARRDHRARRGRRAVGRRRTSTGTGSSWRRRARRRSRRRRSPGCTTSWRGSRSRPGSRSRGCTSCPSRRRTPSRPDATPSTRRSR